MTPASARCIGRVKWWDSHRRIGFIDPGADDGEALFFHAADVVPFTSSPKFNTGDVVTYRPGRSASGPRAFEVVLEV